MSDDWKMKPRRLHKATIFSIKSICLASAIRGRLSATGRIKSNAAGYRGSRQGSCFTVKFLPAMLILPLRSAPVLFGATAYLRVVLPKPLVAEVMVIHFA